MSDSQPMPSILVMPVVGQSKENYKLRSRRRDALDLPGMPWAFKGPREPLGVPFLGDLVLFVFPLAKDKSKFEFSIERVVTGCRELSYGEEAFEGFPWQFETELFELNDTTLSQYSLNVNPGESQEDFYSRGISVAKETLSNILELENGSNELDLVFMQGNGKTVQSYMQGGISAKPAVFLYVPDNFRYQVASSTFTKGETVSPRPRPGSSVEAVSDIDEVDVESLLFSYRNVVVEGVAGTGKSHLIKLLREGGKFAGTEVVIFHPSTSFEDFVEGLRPVGSEFEVQDGRFLSFCRMAAKAASESESGIEPNFLFVIDEINRANTSKVLGDLLYSLEASKRVDALEAHEILSDVNSENQNIDVISVLLPAWRVNSDGQESHRQRFVVPSNVFVLGTMNTTDRSVGQIDLALRRRFMFTRMAPMEPAELLDALKFSAGEEKDKTFFEESIKIWSNVNELLKGDIGPDAQIGHSYFFQVKEMMESDSAHGSVTGDRLPYFLWKSLLLPQISEILVSFNAVDQIDKINQALTGAVGYKLKLVGQGLDGYPMILKNLE